MIIPVRCFTCGTVIGNKYQYYIRTVRKERLNEGTELNPYLDVTSMNKTIEGRVLDELGLTAVCCRRHMLTHVDIR